LQLYARLKPEVTKRNTQLRMLSHIRDKTEHTALWLRPERIAPKAIMYSNNATGIRSTSLFMFQIYKSTQYAYIKTCFQFLKTGIILFKEIYMSSNTMLIFYTTICQ